VRPSPSPLRSGLPHEVNVLTLKGLVTLSDAHPLAPATEVLTALRAKTVPLEIVLHAVTAHLATVHHALTAHSATARHALTAHSATVHHELTAHSEIVHHALTAPTEIVRHALTAHSRIVRHALTAHSATVLHAVTAPTEIVRHAVTAHSATVRHAVTVPTETVLRVPAHREAPSKPLVRKRNSEPTTAAAHVRAVQWAHKPTSQRANPANSPTNHGTWKALVPSTLAATAESTPSTEMTAVSTNRAPREDRPS
jgi:hypothetical protein